jgi:hypothetical protein
MPVEGQGYQLVIVNYLHEIVVYKDTFGLVEEKKDEDEHVD